MRGTIPPAPDFVLQKLPQPEKMQVPPLQLVRGPYQVPTMHTGPKLGMQSGNYLRQVVEADFNELVSFSVPMLQDTYPHLNEGSLVRWLFQQLTNSRVKMLRMDNAWGVAEAGSTFYDPVIRVGERWVISKKSSSDTMKIYRGLADWARSIGAVSFRFGSATGIDIEPFAKRLGFDRRYTTFELDLKKD